MAVMPKLVYWYDKVEVSKLVHGWPKMTDNQELEKLIEAKLNAVIQRINGLERNIEGRILDQKEAMQLALSESEKALAKTAVATEKRFESVNEFRGAYNDLITKMLPRVEYEARYASLSDKIEAKNDAIEDKLDILNAKITDKLSSINEKLTTMEGAGTGLKAGWVIGLGLLTVIATVIGLIIGVVVFFRDWPTAPSVTNHITAPSTPEN